MTGSAGESGAKGIVEDVKGRAKEAIGDLKGDSDMKGEGRAQQDKADAEREIAKKETERARAEAEAEVQEARQEAHERA